MDILSNAEQRMSKAISNFQDAIAVLRTGRANAALLENIECDYYGDRMNITSIAAIKVPEPRQLLIVPYDQGDIKTIVAAINASGIGINPVVDGKQIRLVIPPLTEDRRKELVKKAKGYSEEAKVAIRNIRRDAIDAVKKDETYTEDTRKQEEQEIQKITDKYTKKIDELLKVKESEIMAI